MIGVDPTPDALFLPEPEKDAQPTPERKCAEPGCNNDVALTPTGRRGKYCIEHKDAHTHSTGGATDRPSRGKWAKAQEIETLLTNYVKWAGAGIQVLNAADGRVIATGGPQVVHEIIVLAKDDKRLQKWLERIAQPGKYGPLTIAVLGVAIPIMANHGLLPKFTINIPSGNPTPNEGVNTNGL